MVRLAPPRHAGPVWPDPDAFRAAARAAMSRRFGMPLAPTRLTGCPRPFDLASEDATLLGAIIAPSRRGRREQSEGGEGRADDRSNARRGARGLTTLERAELSEAVLMLTCAPAQQRVLVVGVDRARLEPWLAVYGHLARDVEFWQLRAPGRLERILP